MGCQTKFEQIHKALSQKAHNYNTFQQDIC